MEVDLDRIWSDPTNGELHQIRSAAIQEYANLEQALCGLMAHLGGIEPVVAGTIFFSMVNARSRGRVLQKLIRLRHENTYSLFFNSALKLVYILDGERNEIVHWHMRADVYADETGAIAKVISTLAPPNFWASDENTPSWDAARLEAFCARCAFVMSTLNMFTAGLDGSQPRHDAWRDRYQQPLTYPPRLAPQPDPRPKA